MRSALPAGALLLLFGLVCACRSAPEPDAADRAGPAGAARHAAMRSVIARDEELGRVRNHDPERMSMSEAVSSYARGIAAIDFAGCPPDFVAAFERHRQAWLPLVDALRPFDRMRGEMHEVLDRIAAGGGPEAERVDALVGLVWSTWAEVEASMARHGLVLP